MHARTAINIYSVATIVTLVELLLMIIAIYHWYDEEDDGGVRMGWIEVKV